MPSHAVFWDRDNTLIADPGYINDPDQVALLPGAAEAIRRLAEAGFETALQRSIECEVRDGMLDIEFVPGMQSPMVSGLDIVAVGAAN